MKTLYLDCFSGVSGNMLVGAMLDAGIPFEAFQTAMSKLGLTGYSMVCEKKNKTGIAGNITDRTGGEQSWNWKC